MMAAMLAFGLGCLADSANAAPLQALSSQDAQAYAVAFDAAERGDFTAADAALAKVTDPCLVGRVQYLKIIHAPAKTNTFDQLVGWLKSFGDLPGANVIYSLALKLSPAGLAPPAPTAPPLDLAADSDGRSAPAPQSRAAREAFFNGDVNRALSLAHSDGDAWIAGMAAWRLGRFTDALASFETIADNAAEKDAQRAAGAFWAARAAAAAGQPDRVTPLLRIAAAAPDTFYGMIAARKLQLSDDPMDGVIEAAAKASAMPALSNAALQIPDSSLNQLVSSDARARRAVALAQLGRRVDAGAEMRAGLAEAPDQATRTLWMKLIYRLGPAAPNGEIELHASAPQQATAFYPTPDLAPAGGFTVDKALVYAVAWQESRFNGLAVSPVGAVGLMQLMPPSAADIAGDSSLTSDPVPLFDTGKNLQLGQAYLSWLINKSTGYDILRAVAAYNGGPSTVSRTEALVGSNVDSLTLIESLPYAETRAYVQKVMAAYWTYRRQFGAPSRTLDAAASDAPIIDARLDASAPSQNAKPPGAAPARQALEILLHRG
jgi:soluble lytic murein transglycosylase-like protein